MVESGALKTWFFREVLPLEPALMRFLRHNWRHPAELADLRQDIYTRIYDVARAALPQQTKPFLFAAARKHLIDRAKRSRIISIELMADLAAVNVADVMPPERHLSARQELRRVQAGLERLPARCREVVMLRKLEGLSQREVAARVGSGEDAVKRHTVQGMRALVDFLLGGSLKTRRTAVKDQQEGEGHS